MSKAADEAFQKWQAMHERLGYYPTQYDAAEQAWRAACEWQRQHDLQAVEGERPEIGLGGGDSYERELDNVLDEIVARIKGE